MVALQIYIRGQLKAILWASCNAQFTCFANIFSNNDSTSNHTNSNNKIFTDGPCKSTLYLSVSDRSSCVPNEKIKDFDLKAKFLHKKAASWHF
jgi:hypothetical protein